LHGPSSCDNFCFHGIKADVQYKYTKIVLSGTSGLNMDNLRPLQKVPLRNESSKNKENKNNNFENTPDKADTEE
jgi:hypothetical protein